MEKFGRSSVVVPNVMDFDMKFGEKTAKNQNLRRDLGLEKDDHLLFQITRIVKRKGIEVAIDLINKLKDKTIKLVITGSYKDDAGSLYYNELINQIHELKLSRQIIFASHLIHNKGLMGNGTERNYSLSDAYAHAVACTDPAGYCSHASSRNAPGQFVANCTCRRRSALLPGRPARS